jgi:RNA polymerase sigma-70 factor (ECF subfamily)
VACAGAFEAEFDFVFRTLRRLGARPAEAEDLAQDVFLVMWRRWADFQADRPLRPWLAGIAHHLALDHFRRHSRSEVPLGGAEPLDHAPGPEEQAASARERDLVLRALAALSEHHRGILVRHYLEGRSIREIAAEKALPFFTASARLRRARLRFARAVELLRNGAGPGPGLDPEALLQAESPVPAAPTSARRRLRAWLASFPPAGPSPMPPPALASPSLGPAALALSGMVALAAVLAAWLPGEPAAGGATRIPPSRPAAFAPRSAGGAAARAPIPTTGLVAHWTLDERDGSRVARDVSGHGRDCVLHAEDLSRAWVGGPLGGALDLARGWLECPVAPERAGASLAMSLAAWIKPAPLPAYPVALFSRQLPTGDARHLFWFGFARENLRVWSGAWTGWTTSNLDALDRWTHVAFTHDGPETRLYIDGRRVRRIAGGIPRGDGVVTSTLTIGAARFAPDSTRVRNRFPGLIDDIVLYDRALTDAEVATIAARATELASAP